MRRLGLRGVMRGKQALCARQPERDGSLVGHCDRGSQYFSTQYTERLVEAS